MLFRSVEGVIAAWHKKVGDTVKRGELLAEIETDKATMEYESYQSGTLLYIGAQAKEAVAINGVLAIIGEPDADWKSLLNAYQATGGKPEPAAATPAASASAPSPAATPAATPSASDSGRIKASPLAKKMARDLGYDLTRISGTGDNGDRKSTRLNSSHT